MTLIRVLPLLSAVLALSACQTAYVIPQGQPTAKIKFDVSTDSTNTTLVTNRIEAYKNLQCEASPHGQLIATDRIADKKSVYPELDIVAEEPFTFTVHYMEARFAQNRDCLFTASFVPKSGHTYQASFNSVGNVSYCTLAISDQSTSSPESVQFSSPVQACGKSLAKGSPDNGKPGYLKWKATGVPTGVGTIVVPTR